MKASRARIAFLAGNLEPGKDGVGDYTRLLAGECARLGVRCLVVALADRQVGRALSETTSGIDTVRLPAALPWIVRRDRLERLVQSFAPTWISLQYVPYSFHRKGLAIRLAQDLPRVIALARLHIMVHEPWIGGDGSWRRGLISAGQRWCALKLCRHPGTVVHTSNRLYQQMLAKYAVEARCLPLFGSIPLSTSGPAWLPPVLAATGCDLFTRRADWWLFVMFGTLHPVWPPEPVLSAIQRAAVDLKKKLALISVGCLGPGEPLWSRLQARYASAFPMLRLGEQPVERIAELLNAADFGLATSPYSLLGKSATVAAMLEHGLPIVVNRDDGPHAPVTAEDRSDRDLIVPLDSRFAERLSHARRRAPESRLPRVAAQFLAELGHA